MSITIIWFCSPDRSTWQQQRPPFLGASYSFESAQAGEFSQWRGKEDERHSKTANFQYLVECRVPVCSREKPKPEPSLRDHEKKAFSQEKRQDYNEFFNLGRH